MLVVLFTLLKNIQYYVPIGAMILMSAMFAILVMQPYKEQFKVYNFIDSFMLLLLASIYMIFTSANEANIKGTPLSILSTLFLVLLCLIPLLYFVILIIWWLVVKKLKLKQSCL